MWGNYYKSNIEPTLVPTDDDILPSSITSKITCTGKSQFKIGGSAKTFTVTYYDKNSEVIEDHAVGEWTFTIDDTPVNEELLTLTPDGNKLKVKFLGDDSYIGKILTITNTSEDAVANLQVEIIAL